MTTKNKVLGVLIFLMTLNIALAGNVIIKNGIVNASDSYIGNIDYSYVQSPPWILTSDEANLNVNSSSYWGSYATASDLNNKITLDAANITSGTLTQSLIPDQSNLHTHDAGNVTSGTFDVYRIPDLDSAKITSGSFDIARMPTGGLWSLSSNLNISGKWIVNSTNGFLGYQKSTPSAPIDLMTLYRTTGSTTTGVAMVLGPNSALVGTNGVNGVRHGSIILDRGNGNGMALTDKNKLETYVGTATASVAYSSKVNESYFVFNIADISNGLPEAGNTFTVGGNTYTVAGTYTNGASSRLYVYENLSLENDTGTLTDLRYATFATVTDANGNVGIGTTSPSYKLDVVGVNVLSGADAPAGTVRTDNTVKAGAITFAHYTNAEQPLDGIHGVSDATTNDIYIGGGTSLYNAATGIHLFTAASSTTTTGTERLTIDSSGKVGIGTTSPAAPLHVYSTQTWNETATTTPIATLANYNAVTATGQTALKFVSNQITGTSQYDRAAIVGRLDEGHANNNVGQLDFYTADGSGVLGNRMSITYDGKVGIGTNAPDTITHIYAADPMLKIQDTDTNWHTAQAWLRFSDKAVSPGYWDIGMNGNDQGLAFNFGASNKMTILYGGNVGIGTASPGALLDVNGNSIVGRSASVNGVGTVSVYDEGSSNYISLYKRGSNATGSMNIGKGAGELVNVNGNLSINSYTAGTHIEFGTGNTERVRIDSSGNVGIGTTSPASKLDVRDGNVELSDADVTHGMTNFLPTNSYGHLGIFDGTKGGLDIIGASDDDSNPLIIRGYFGVTDPTDTTPAIVMIGAKKNGADGQVLGSSETVLQIRNYATNLMTVLGSGNVGIGTVSPASKLHVESVGDLSMTFRGGDADNAYINWGRTSGTTDFVSGVNYQDYYVIASNDTINSVSGIFMDNAGKVGIGTVSPGQKLAIAGNAQLTTGGYLYGDTTSQSLLLSSSSGSKLSYDASNYVSIGGNVITFGTNPGETMRITNGNVGIGTTNPTSKLLVQGSRVTLNDSSTYYPSYELYNGTKHQGWFGASAANTYLYATAGQSLTLAANGNTVGTEMIKITSAGAIGVGTGSPAGKFGVADGTNGQLYFAFDGSRNYIESADNAASAVRDLWITGHSASAMNNFLVFATNTTINGEAKVGGVASDGTGKVLCVKADGNIGTCSTQPNTSGVCTCG